MTSSLPTVAFQPPSSALMLDPCTDCHQRLRWGTPPDPSTPPPLVIHRFVPLIRRPQRIIYGYGDASISGAGGYWNEDSNGFFWRAPMGLHQGPADSLSRWRSGQAGYVPTVEELLRMVQTQALVQDLVNTTPEVEELEYVD
jgi:hypothetical protein